jgi:hypothetical protein
MIRFNILRRRDASEVLSQRDDYTDSLNTLTLNILRCRDSNEFLNKMNNITSDFTPQENQQINNQMEEINTKLLALGLVIDLEIDFVKTSGMESMGMPYTRHNAVVLTQPYLQAFSSGMQIPNVNMGMGLVAHEIFHIISREYPQVRTALYDLWNFYHEPLDTVPAEALINPDAPNCDYKINVTMDGEEIAVTPMLAIQGRPSMQSFMAADKLLYTNRGFINRSRTNYLEACQSPVEISAYHPEEISAEAFRLLIEGQNFEKSPDVLAIFNRYFNF